MKEWFEEMQYRLWDRAFDFYGGTLCMFPDWIVWIPYPFRHFVLTIIELNTHYTGLKILGLLALLVTLVEMVSVIGFLIKLVLTIRTYLKNRSWIKEDSNGRKRIKR